MAKPWCPGRLQRHKVLLTCMAQPYMHCVCAESFSLQKRGFPQLPGQTFGHVAGLLQCLHLWGVSLTAVWREAQCLSVQTWPCFPLFQIDRWLFCLIKSYFMSSGPQLVGHQWRGKSSSPSAHGCERRGYSGELQKKAIEKSCEWGRRPGVKARGTRVKGSLEGLRRYC